MGRLGPGLTTEEATTATSSQGQFSTRNFEGLGFEGGHKRLDSFLRCGVTLGLTFSRHPYQQSL